MPSYRQLTARLDSDTGVTSVDICAPDAGFSELISALRIYYINTNTDQGAGFATMFVTIEPAAGTDIVVAQYELITGAGLVVADAMPLLSNLAAYGMSSPDKLTARMTTTLATGDVVLFQGFSVRGADA